MRPPAREHALQLGQRRRRIGQQVEGVAADDQGERAVLVGQRVEVDQREGDVDEAELAGEPLALLEHVGQLVGRLDAAHVRRHREPGHAGARGVVEHRVVRCRAGQVDEQVERCVAHLVHSFSLRRRLSGIARPAVVPVAGWAGVTAPAPTSAVGDGEDGPRHAETDADLVAVDPRRLAVIARGVAERELAGQRLGHDRRRGGARPAGEARSGTSSVRLMVSSMRRSAALARELNRVDELARQALVAQRVVDVGLEGDDAAAVALDLVALGRAGLDEEFLLGEADLAVRE